MVRKKIQDVPGIIVALILVKAVFDNVLSDYLWVRSIMMLSPTISTIGASCRRRQLNDCPVFFYVTLYFCCNIDSCSY